MQWTLKSLSTNLPSPTQSLYIKQVNTNQMYFPFTDTPQVEEVMYQWTDESIEQFLNEQGDILGMEIQCDEFNQNDYTV